ncbi:MAG: hypothetical protein AB8B50_12360 [Pirellulaceae bacterium]
MELDTLQEALGDLPDSKREDAGRLSEDSYARALATLGSLVDGDLPLQVFLEQLLPVLTKVLGATGGVVWLKAQGAPGAVFGVRYQLDGILNTASQQKKHDRLVQIAWQQRQPMLAEPTSTSEDDTNQGTDESNAYRLGAEGESSLESSAADESANANPTDHMLLFGPILHAGESIALLEILFPEPKKTLTQAEKRLYLRVIQLFAERIYLGLKKRMMMPEPTLQRAVEQMAELQGQIQSLQSQMVRSIEQTLQQFHGWSFGSLRENQALAKLIHQLLDSHGLRVQCPECGNPAILRCLRAGNAKHGAFVFDHYLETGRTFHGGPTTVPLIKVVKKPARRTAVNNSA